MAILSQLDAVSSNIKLGNNVLPSMLDGSQGLGLVGGGWGTEA